MWSEELELLPCTSYIREPSPSPPSGCAPCPQVVRNPLGPILDMLQEPHTLQFSLQRPRICRQGLCRLPPWSVLHIPLVGCVVVGPRVAKGQLFGRGWPQRRGASICSLVLGSRMLGRCWRVDGTFGRRHTVRREDRGWSPKEHHSKLILDWMGK